LCPKHHLLLRSFAKTDCSSLAPLSRFIGRVVDTAAAANEAASDRTATGLTFERPCWAQRLAPKGVPSEDRAGMAGKNVDSIHRILSYC
jgi:hypothetical protein